jgi:hypothetical protein
LEEQTVNTIALDKDLQARWKGLDQQLLVTDDKGDPLGYFLPAQDYRNLMLRSLAIPLSAEEIARRRQETAGSSLEDIWKRLEGK